MTRRFFTRRGLRLSYLDSRPAGGAHSVVLLLHGFPDEAAMWEPMIPRLHDAGVRVLAPDTVGCGQSSVASRRSDYTIAEILGDAIALMDHVGVSRVDVVGHDWGAGLAWALAMRHPHRVRRLCAVSLGHPGAFVRGGARQKLMSWYIAYFHLAGLADRLLLGGGRLGLRHIFGSHPEIDTVMHRLSEPGRMTAALRIYRANIAREVFFTRHTKVWCPALCVHSTDDVLLAERQARDSRFWVDGPFRHVELGGGHWIPLEQPERLTRLVLEHLAPADATEATGRLVRMHLSPR